MYGTWKLSELQHCLLDSFNCDQFSVICYLPALAEFHRILSYLIKCDTKKLFSLKCLVDECIGG